jgi:hypothetical protein
MLISDHQNTDQNHKIITQQNPSKYVTNSEHLEKTATITITMIIELKRTHETRRMKTSERAVASSDL